LSITYTNSITSSNSNTISMAKILGIILLAFTLLTGKQSHKQRLWIIPKIKIDSKVA